MGVAFLVAILTWQGLSSHGVPDPLSPTSTRAVAIVNTAVLVFREGLECILVLAAITANMGTTNEDRRRSISAGVIVGLVATIATWFATVGMLDDLTRAIPALQIQAATGLLAVCVLLLVMNWFFHKVYWTGWISAHNKRKRDLLARASTRGLAIGFAALGFTAVYREGFEVVLFLQSYRLKLGPQAVAYGAALGGLLTAIVGALTFVAHRRLPYKKMLVMTGILLAVVLLVMVGEQAQEMQLAHWLPTTQVNWLARVLPPWTGLWLSVFPTVETLTAQAVAMLLVLGSYLVASRQVSTRPICR